MALSQKAFNQLVTDMVNSWSAAIGIVPTLSNGDALLAIFQSVAAQLDYLQNQALQIVLLTRAQTSSGSDLDTWMAQFGFFREAATLAEGEVTFTKLVAATSPVYIYPGAIVQTTGGAIQYQVIADTTQVAWNPTQGAYELQIGYTSILASVQALVAGAASNIAAGQLNQIGSSIPGIDLVNNGSPISNGINAESDDAFRARFVAYLGSLSQATESAILSAVNGVQQGLQISLLENINGSGFAQLGAFTVVVDNGTGAPPSSLLTAIYNAVYAVRAFTVQPFVIGPSVVTATIVISIHLASGYSATPVEVAVQNAIAEYINQTAIGGVVYISSIEAAALSVPGVAAVKPNNTTLNAAQADLTLTNVQAARTVVGDISVSTY